MGHSTSYVSTFTPNLLKFSEQSRQNAKFSPASIVPYSSFKTLDGDILFGGGNDRLFGVLCTKLERPEWATDDRFLTNKKRVENRIAIEGLIESETRTKTTAEWLQIFEGSGMPYAAVNDIQATMNHEHGEFKIR